MTMLSIITAPVAGGVMDVCVADEVDMVTAEQVTDAVRTALAGRRARCASTWPR
jgi:hypothetical protein